MSVWQHAALVAVAVTLAFANTFGNGWHYDDLHVITQNPHVRSLDDPLRFFADPTQFSRDADKAMYRPLLLVTFALNHAWSGLETYSYHAVNLGLHVACSLLVWQILLALGRRPRTALLGALFFGLHPLATEPVNYISSRSEVLAALWVMAAFHLHQRARRSGNPWPRAASVAAFALGLLTKEVAIVAPALLLAHDATRRGGLLGAGGRGLLPRAWIPYAAVACAYLAIVGHHLSRAAVTEPVRGPAAQLATQVKAGPHYARLLAFPVGLNVHHQFYESGAVPVIGLAAAALLSVAALTVRPPRGDLALGLGWAAIAMAPTALVPLHVLVNDHRLYLPLAGAAIALTCLASDLRCRRVIAALAVALLVLGVTTGQRNRVWRDEYTLWTDAAAKSPRPLVPVAYVHLGNYAQDHGALDEAVDYFQRALQIAPRHVAARLNLATALQRLGRVDEAIAIAEGVVADEPGLADAWYSLGKACQQRGDTLKAGGSEAEALAAYEQAREAYRRVSLDSYHHDLALNNLGTTFERTGRLDSAAHYYRRALEHRRDSPDAASNAARLREQLPARAAGLIDTGRYAELETLCQELLRLGGDDAEPLYFLAASRFLQGRYRDSLEPNLQLVARHPAHEQGYLQLANAYETLGDTARAAQAYRQQLDRIPAGDLAPLARRRLARLEAPR